MSGSSHKARYRRVGIIMAGGSGERFWPLSRNHRPKQLLCLSKPDCCLLEEAVSRLAKLIPPQDIYVVAGEQVMSEIRQTPLAIPKENILAEPCKRNTAGALAYVTAHLLAQGGRSGPELTMAVISADHVIGDAQRFCQTVEVALEVAQREEALVCLGIIPTRADTGYGYIQVANPEQPLPGETEGIRSYPVAAFHEKPSREKAEDFITTGNYLWNAGMFFWNVSTFLEELEQVRPELVRAIRELTAALQDGDSGQARVIFEVLEDISIDYALMEHARQVVVIRADFPWDDIGSWTALDRTYPHDAHGNVTVGDPVVIDSRDSIIYNEPGAQSIAVSVIGMHDVVVAVTRDGVLVASKDRAQDVRHAVRELKRRGAEQV
jgi:mannose-1-phosphate guanylyltransferase